MSISIIVPTFNNVDYLGECINSIYNSAIDVNYELMIGIDACEKTLDFLKTFSLNENTKIYLFENNGGPYIIKNTLAKIAIFDKLLFFDSDDIMDLISVQLCDEGLKKYHVVKCLYKNFTTQKDLKIINPKKNYGEGVFAIQKEIFLTLNGFEGWRVAADSDFMFRLYKNRAKIWYPKELQFLRRVHPSSLTMSENTGWSSDLRKYYANISKQKTYFGPLQELKIGNFMEIVLEKNKIMDLKNFTKENFLSEQEINLRENRKKLSKILKNENIKPSIKQSNTINYDNVNKNQIKRINIVKDALNKTNLINNFSNRSFQKKIIK